MTKGLISLVGFTLSGIVRPIILPLKIFWLSKLQCLICIPKPSFNKIQDHLSSWLKTVNEDVAFSFLDCDKEGEEEDEVSLMWLGGWALFSCM